MTQPSSEQPDTALRLCHADAGIAAAAAAAGLEQDAWLQRLRQRGYNAVLAPATELDHSAQGAAASACAVHGLALYRDVDLRGGVRAETSGPGGPDPRALAWAPPLRDWAAAGVGGVFFRHPSRMPRAFWHELLTAARAERPAPRCVAWCPGLSPREVAALRGAGFDDAVSSLPWWDFRAAWLGDEDARLRAIGPVVASPPASADCRAVWAAVFCGDSVLFTAAQDARLPDVPEALTWHATTHLAGPLHCLAGRDGCATLLARASATGGVRVLALNASDSEPARIDWDALAALLPPGDFDTHPSPVSHVAQEEPLPPAGAALHALRRHPARPRTATPTPASRADALSRIAVENVGPAVDGGRHAVKRIAHERVRVSADIFVDGHEALAAEVLWRAGDEPGWRRAPMACVGNDRWEAEFRPTRLGLHEFVVCAWCDAWETYRHALSAKHAAGQDTALDVREGLDLLRETLEQARQSGAPGQQTAAVRHALRLLAHADADAAPGQDVQALLAEGLASAIRELARHGFETRTAPYPLWVDRNRAAYASWYELFPRSQASEAGRHGTFDDVIGRLPDIREMGFDVVYLPPIHPIGRTRRKGPNNALQAGPGDPGSPYAIGSDDGGHKAIEPALGSMDDFLRLVKAARALDMEIALDFAIQCSPDHPWLKQHPEWFGWRADGSLRHAENPPKKYEDIVNVAFYGAGPRHPRKLALWRALRDVVLFWLERGVRIFRVDNPHTKPLPFWQWLIADIHGRHPEAIFLSEAFTRPAMMRRLAKIGFTQSYTYFTWRNHKRELADYFRELSGAPSADYFRPNFFVNTPDINPPFLQESGRAGFLIRAALAATASGLWGIYSGFELCESQGLPGREEYQDSEKYQLRQRDWFQPGHIREEIARLNQIRRANPALHTHRGTTPMATDHDRVLAYVRASEGLGNVVMVAVSLDPHSTVQTQMETPRALLGLPDGAALAAEDLLDERTEWWHGSRVPVRLEPQRPYRVWRLSRQG
jgi:starch synthase (maltosyl-transferring)